MRLKLLIRDPAGFVFVVIPWVAAAVLLTLGAMKLSRVRALEDEFTSRRGHFLAVLNADPAPRAENIEVIQNQVNDLKAQFHQALTSLFGNEPRRTHRGAEINPEDLFFEIIEYTERVSKVASDRSIRLSNDLKFGFGDIVRDGRLPLEDFPSSHRSKAIGALQSQLGLLEHLVELLLAADPDRVVSVRRAVYDEDGGQHWRREREVFVDESLEVKSLPSWLSVSSVEITFEGQTGVLRSVLNGLVELKIAAIPRELKVEPVNEPIAGNLSPENRRSEATNPGPFDGVSLGNRTDSDNREKGLIPIISRNASRFCLLIDLYEVRSSPINVGGIDPWEAYR